MSDQRYLLKFIVTSAMFFFIGTVHGVLQVIPPIRAWLDSIGSPYGGPGHMIDPLAHAHVNVVGGVVLLIMAVSFYLLRSISGKPIYSIRLANHSYWWTTIGVACFYTTLIVFGVWQGHYMLLEDTVKMDEIHSIYGPIIATVSTVMGIGFWVFFFNIFMTVKNIIKKQQ